MRILWCDDNADMREYVRRLLADRYQVTVASDGIEALSAARREPPDLVLSDVMMPRLDGFGLLKKLREEERTATIPIILLSARAGEEAAVEGLAAGADDYLIKPFSAKELLARVHSQLTMSAARREFASKLQSMNRQLEQVVKEARAAREDALGAARMQAKFLATMSHEIRTPLNAVLGFAGLLADTELAPRQREFVTAIRGSGDHLLRIIDDVLDFSKLQAGHFELYPVPFNIRRSVEAALDFVAGRAAEKGIDLAYVIGSRVPRGMEADELRVRQILINFLSNAVKFTDSGEVVVRVQSVPLEEPGRHEFRFSVHDTGVGIAADRMNRLFQDFSQVDAAVSTKYGGTGLGLAICKKLAELHGGRVWAESTINKGSAFYLALPAPVRADFASKPPRLRSYFRGLKVLIIDDNLTNLEILRAQTESWGMFVRATQDPQQALSWIELGDPFDLILTDHRMPAMDGLELARRIRSKQQGHEIPMILLTSLGSEASTMRQVAAYFDAVISKPIRQSELFDRVNELFNRSAPKASYRSSAPPVDMPPLTILLAEDNAMNQKVALSLLESIGYRADLARDGARAIQALEYKPYDVILMDVQMPIMDGLTATRSIRARAGELHQPQIIAMTANALPGDREDCLSAGCNDYLSKPIAIEQLVLALRTAAGKLSTPSARVEPASSLPSSEVDLAVLARLMGSLSTDSAASVLDIFLVDTPRLLAELRTADKVGDDKLLLASAHQLKSNCRTIGARGIGALCEKIEERCRSRRSASELINELTRRFALVEAELAAARHRYT